MMTDRHSSSSLGALALLIAASVPAALLISACSGNEASGAADIGSEQTAAITWYRDVLPIAQSACMGCHVEGGSGPFPMETKGLDDYEELLRPLAGVIAQEVDAGNMPPWQPADGCRDLQGVRSITEAQKATILAWASSGAEPGDVADAPDFVPVRTKLDDVTMTLEPEFGYLPTTLYGDDDLHCFVLDPELDAERDLIGYQVVPGSKPVHHVLLYKVPRDEALALDAETAGPGYPCFGGPGASQPSVMGGWVPGMPPNQYPEGTGIRVEPESVIVMQTHYNFFSGAPTVEDRTTVQLQFSDSPVSRPAMILGVPNHSFAIPPRSEGYSIESTQDVPQDVTLWAVAPHMHIRGRTAKVHIEKADGSEECVVDIPKWNFDWQQFYFFEEGLPLQKGDVAKLTCTWDNETDDVITWGDGTGDEMCIFYAYVTL